MSAAAQTDRLTERLSAEKHPAGSASPHSSIQFILITAVRTRTRRQTDVLSVYSVSTAATLLMSLFPELDSSSEAKRVRGTQNDSEETGRCEEA